LEGGHVEFVVDESKNLDCCISFTNLNRLALLGRIGEIPKAPPKSYLNRVFSRTTDPVVRLPRQVTLTSQKTPVHIRNFHRDLAHIAPKLPSQLESSFTAAARSRGKALQSSGYVLQLALQYTKAHTWLLKCSVGASYNRHYYMTALELSVSSGLIKTGCSCVNGYV